MKAIVCSIDDLMDEHLGVYQNPNGIEFCQHPDLSFCLACDWPGESHDSPISVSLAYECDTTLEFVEAFALKQIIDIDRITPLTVLELYKKAKAEVSCMINDSKSYSLTFKIRGNKLFAITDPGGDEHQVPELIQDPDRFKEYTLTYLGAYAI
jgi:hypothetical protein